MEYKLLENLRDAVGLYLKHAVRKEVEQLQAIHKESPIVAPITM